MTVPHEQEEYEHLCKGFILSWTREVDETFWMTVLIFDFRKTLLILSITSLTKGRKAVKLNCFVFKCLIFDNYYSEGYAEDD